MKRLVLILMFLLCLSSWLQAQESSSQSKVRLIDGSQLNVRIIENVPGDYIKIQLPGSEIANIDYAEIKSIKHQSFSYYAKFELPKGFYWDGAFSIMVGRTAENGSLRAGIAAGLTANYRFNPYISMGLGVEPSLLFTNYNYLLIPLYAHFSGTFTPRRVAPIYFVDGGWSYADINTSSDFNRVEGGWFVRPGVGIRIDHISLTLGYQLQKITTTSENTWWWGNSNEVTVEERTVRNINFGVHISF